MAESRRPPCADPSPTYFCGPGWTRRPSSMLVAFAGSGLIHDLVISVPAGAGYGLPTAYFSLQGLALLLERAPIGRRLGLGAGVRGRLFAIAVSALPAFWLFHPAFVLNVVVPFLRVIGAR